MFVNLNNTIKEMPLDVPFFKGVVIVPIIGLVAQLWKRFTQIKNLSASQAQFSLVKGPERLRTNDFLAQKATAILQFSSQSLQYGKFGDIACVIAGIATKFFSPTSVLGIVFMQYGLASLALRYCCIVRDRYVLSSFQTKCQNCIPEIS